MFKVHLEISEMASSHPPTSLPVLRESAGIRPPQRRQSQGETDGRRRKTERRASERGSATRARSNASPFPSTAPPVKNRTAVGRDGSPTLTVTSSFHLTDEMVLDLECKRSSSWEVLCAATRDRCSSSCSMAVQECEGATSALLTTQ